MSPRFLDPAWFTDDGETPREEALDEIVEELLDDAYRRGAGSVLVPLRVLENLRDLVDTLREACE